MSQAIGNIVYGVRFTPEMRRLCVELGLVENERNRREFDDAGFTTDYSASGQFPVWCGVLLGAIEECDDVRISSIPTAPTPEVREKVLAMIDDMPEELRFLADAPQMWIIWGSS